MSGADLRPMENYSRAFDLGYRHAKKGQTSTPDLYADLTLKKAYLEGYQQHKLEAKNQEMQPYWEAFGLGYKHCFESREYAPDVWFAEEQQQAWYIEGWQLAEDTQGDGGMSV